MSFFSSKNLSLILYSPQDCSYSFLPREVRKSSTMNAETKERESLFQLFTLCFLKEPQGRKGLQGIVILSCGWVYYLGTVLLILTCIYELKTSVAQCLNREFTCQESEWNFSYISKDVENIPGGIFSHAFNGQDHPIQSSISSVQINRISITKQHSPRFKFSKYRTPTVILMNLLRARLWK